MAKFVLTAQLKLRGPTNVAAIAADIRKQLEGAFALDVTAVVNASKTLDTLKAKTDGATAAATGLGKAFGVSLKRFAAFSIATRAVGVFSAGLSNAIDEAISFQRETVRLLQVTNNAAGAVKDISDEVTRLATTLGVSSKELISVSNILAQAGLSAKETKIALDALAKSELAPSFNNIKETAEGVVAIFNQFGAGAEAISGQLGAINAVAAKFAVEASDLIDVVRIAGGVFKASGGDLNDLLAIFTSVRATTRESSESIATGLKTIFTRIQRPATIAYLKQLGVELTDIDGRFVGAFEATKRLSEAFSGLEQGDVRFIRIAEELGGYRQISKVIPLLQQFKIAEEARQVAIKGAGSLDKDAALAQQALSVQITKVKEEFLALIRSLADTASFQVMVKTTLSLASAFINIAAAIKPVLPLLMAFAAIKLTQSIGGFFGNVGAAVGAAGASARTKKAKGGRVYGFARGGMVPGSGNGDTVPAMLEPGEFVIRKSSVQSIGQDRLAGMNKYARGGMIQRFATAGLVSQAPLVDDIANTKDAMKPRPGVSAGSPLSEILRTGHGALDFDRTLQRTVGDQAYANAKNDKQKQAVIDRYFANDAARLRDAKSAKLTQFGKELEALIKAGQIDPRKLTLISKSPRTPGLPEHVKGLFGIPLENMIFTSGGSKQPALDAMRSKGPRVDRVQRKALGADLGAIRKMEGGSTDNGVSPQAPNIIKIFKELERRIREENYKPTEADLASVNKGSKTHRGVELQNLVKEREGTIGTPIPKTTNQQKKYQAAIDQRNKAAETNFMGTDIARQGKVGAAILETGDHRDTQALKISPPEINAALSKRRLRRKTEKNDGSLPEFKAIQFHLERSGINKDYQKDFIDIIDSNLIEATNRATAEIVNKIPALGDSKNAQRIPSLTEGSKMSKNFLKSINSASKGNLFENVLNLLKGNTFDDSVDPNRPFDFTNSIGSASKAFERPMTLDYVDAKASLKQSSDKIFKEKIANQIVLEMILKNQDKLQEPETEYKDAFEKIKKRKPKTQAKGGTSGSTDTIPALLTPGEFVFNSKSARKIGYGNLNSMNKRGVAGFAAGGAVGVQRFQAGGSPIPTPTTPQGLGGIDKLLIALPAVTTALSSFSNSTTETGKAIQFLNSAFISAGSIYLLVSSKVKQAEEERANKIKINAEAISTSEKTLKGQDRERRTAQVSTDIASDNFVKKATVHENTKNEFKDLDIVDKKTGRFTSSATNADKARAIGVSRQLQAATAKLASEQENLKSVTNKVAQSEKELSKLRSQGSQLSGKMANFNSFLSKFGPIVSASLVIAQQALTFFAEKAQRDANKLLEDGNVEGALSKTRESVQLSQAGDVASGALSGAVAGGVIGSAVPIIGTAIGATVGGIVGGAVAYFSRDLEAERKAEQGVIESGASTLGAQQDKRQAKFSKGNYSARGFAIDTSKASDELSKLSKKSSLTKEQRDKYSSQAAQADLAAATSLGADLTFSAKESAEALKILTENTAGSAKEEINAYNAARNLALAHKEVTKANFDALKINSVFNAASLAVDNFVKGLESGSSSLDGYIAILEASQTNLGLSNEAKEAGSFVREDLLNRVGEGSEIGKSIERSFNSLEQVGTINTNLQSELTGLDLSKYNGPQAKEQLTSAITRATEGNDQARKIALAEIANIPESEAGKTDLSTLIKNIQEGLKPLGQAAIDSAKALSNHNKTIVELTKKRKAAEEQYIEAQKQAIDIHIEARKAFEEFGGKKFTPKEEFGKRIEQFNVSAQAAGIGGLKTGSAADIVSVGAEIERKFIEQQGKVLANGAAGGNKFSDARGLDADKRAELNKANKELIKLTQQALVQKREELAIVQKKNAQEKSALEKLLSGDIEGFLADQASAGAAEVLKSGDASLAGLFSASALGAGFKSLEGQGLSAPDTERAAQLALGGAGLTDFRSAQVLAGTTAEEKTIKSQGQELSRALDTQGNIAANLEAINATVAQATIFIADAKFSSELGKKVQGFEPAERRASGGLIYANRGIFVPRGTDTVPAMLTPGEFVVNRRSVQRGNNLQLLKAMNNGGGTSQGLSRGGKVGYYSDGVHVPNGGGGFGMSDKLLSSLETFNTNFKSNIDKLNNTTIQVRLDATAVNVNFNGTGFLSSLTETIGNKVLEIVATEIPKYRTNQSGDLERRSGTM